MSLDPAAHLTVAGYRVLRTVSRRAGVEVHVGFDDGQPDDGSTRATVELKVVTDARALRHEIEALDRARGPHVVDLIDVSIERDSGCLVLPRLGITLAELLHARDALEPGEAVTILAPLATTLIRIHAAGLAHTRISESVIAFDADGAPVITDFDHASLFAAGHPEALLEAEPGVIDDREAFRRLVSSVLERTRSARTGRVAAFQERVRSVAHADLLDLVASGAFELAEPAVVSLDAGSRRDAGMPARAVDPAGIPQQADETQARSSWFSGLLPDALRDAWGTIGRGGGVARVRAAWASWSARRRRLTVGAAAVGLSFAMVTMLVPAGSAPIVPGGMSDPSPTAGQSTPPDPDTAGEADPVVAVVALLVRRDDCLRELSVLCLEGVDQPGSSASDLDRAVLRAIQEGDEIPDWRIAGGAPTLTERLGDSALVAFPAGSAISSVLLMRTDDGWRIRDYLTASR